VKNCFREFPVAEVIVLVILTVMKNSDADR
jgi:hypothetical protein